MQIILLLILAVMSIATVQVSAQTQPNQNILGCWSFKNSSFCFLPAGTVSVTAAVCGSGSYPYTITADQVLFDIPKQRNQNGSICSGDRVACKITPVTLTCSLTSEKGRLDDVVYQRSPNQAAPPPTAAAMATPSSQPNLPGSVSGAFDDRVTVLHTGQLISIERDTLNLTVNGQTANYLTDSRTLFCVGNRKVAGINNLRPLIGKSITTYTPTDAGSPPTTRYTSRVEGEAALQAQIIQGKAYVTGPDRLLIGAGCEPRARRIIQEINSINSIPK